MSTFEPACLHRNCPGDVSGPGHSSFLQFEIGQGPMCWSHIIPLQGLFGPPEVQSLVDFGLLASQAKRTASSLVMEGT